MTNLFLEIPDNWVIDNTLYTSEDVELVFEQLKKEKKDVEEEIKRDV